MSKTPKIKRLNLYRVIGGAVKKLELKSNAIKEESSRDESAEGLSGQVMAGSSKLTLVAEKAPSLHTESGGFLEGWSNEELLICDVLTQNTDLDYRGKLTKFNAIARGRYYEITLATGIALLDTADADALTSGEELIGRPVERLVEALWLIGAKIAPLGKLDIVFKALTSSSPFWSGAEHPELRWADRVSAAQPGVRSEALVISGGKIYLPILDRIVYYNPSLRDWFILGIIPGNYGDYTHVIRLEIVSGKLRIAFRYDRVYQYGTDKDADHDTVTVEEMTI